MTKRTISEHRTKPKVPPERQESLWLLTLAPVTWMLHFLLSYVTAAIWCAKVVGRNGSLEGARLAISIYTVLALLGIGLVIWRGFRKASFGKATVPHDFATAADRHRFLGFATVLLGGLSGVATLYVAFAVVFIDSCL